MNSIRNSISKVDKVATETTGLSTTTLLLIVVALVLVYYWYTKKHENFESMTPDDAKTINMALFYADWCGHCKTFKPIWNKVKQDMDGKSVNGVKVTFSDINADEQGDVVKEYNVEGFPTVKCITNNAVMDFDQDRSEEGLMSYIRSVTASL